MTRIIVSSVGVRLQTLITTLSIIGGLMVAPTLVTEFPFTEEEPKISMHHNDARTCVDPDWLWSHRISTLKSKWRTNETLPAYEVECVPGIRCSMHHVSKGYVRDEIDWAKMIDTSGSMGPIVWRVQ